MTRGQETIARPKQVGTAVLLLYTALAAAGIRSVIEAATNAKLLGPEFMILMLVVISVVLGLMTALIGRIGRGRNWARMTMLGLFLLALAMSFGPLLHSFPLRPIPCAFGLAQFFLQLAALLLLFSKGVSSWFRAGSSSDPRSR